MRTLEQLQTEARMTAERLGHALTRWEVSYDAGVWTALCMACLDVTNVEPGARVKLEVRGSAVTFKCRKRRADSPDLCRHCAAPMPHAWTVRLCAHPARMGPCEL